MANILLGVTGSVAAIYTPELYAALTSAGHEVKVAATRSALYFFDPAQVAPLEAGRRHPERVILDEDEWPGGCYRRGDPVLHIELRRWAQVLLIAPLDANTLAKLANGICDNCLTCVYRAWDRIRPVVLAPAMNTFMWEHPATSRHFAQIAEDLCGPTVPSGIGAAAQLDWINGHCPTLTIVPPITKELACDDVGFGALADRPTIVDAVQQSLAKADRR
jgi:phosphopantothenoylcysteine decarboxylase